MKFKYIIILYLLMTTGLQSQETVVSLTGAVKNYLTNEPLGIEIRVFNMEGKQISISKSNSKDGYYFITGLKPDSVYFIKFMDFSYLADSHEFQVPNTRKYQEYSRDFLVKPKKAGLKFPLKVIPFDIGKSKLRVGADYYLNEIANLMKHNRRVEFVIKAYPDNDNSQGDNSTLSQNRAEALKEYFVKMGVNPEKIIIESQSSTDKDNPPPPITTKQAKGKRYIGPIYLELSKV